MYQTPKEPWITTHSGVPLLLNNPRPEDIVVDDIAHALANVTRYNGHATSFYSVAQHSYLVSLMVPAEDALWGLLHDASEAYIADMPSPVKNLPEMAGYRQVEDRIMAAVCRKFDLPLQMPASVKDADERMLFTEKRDIVPPGPDWGWARAPYHFTIIPEPPGAFKQRFLDRFNQLTNNRFR